MHNIKSARRWRFTCQCVNIVINCWANVVFKSQWSFFLLNDKNTQPLVAFTVPIKHLWFCQAMNKKKNHRHRRNKMHFTWAQGASVTLLCHSCISGFPQRSADFYYYFLWFVASRDLHFGIIPECEPNLFFKYYIKRICSGKICGKKTKLPPI